MNHKNSVFLMDYMGSDKSHSVAAWASTFLELDIPMPTDPKIRVDQIFDHIMQNSKRMRSMEDLLNFLAQHNHESPFRMSSFLYGMTTEVATHIQKLKHSILLEAENAESARYKELKEDKYYLPDDWFEVRVQNQEVKDWLQYPKEEYLDWFLALQEYTELGNKLYHQASKELKPILGAARTKETARFFKTYNSQLNSVNKFSFGGVMQFYRKRAADNAQVEIREVAKEMVKCIREIPGEPFKYSLKAFGL